MYYKLCFMTVTSGYKVINICLVSKSWYIEKQYNIICKYILLYKYIYIHIDNISKQD